MELFLLFSFFAEWKIVSKHCHFSPYNWDSRFCITVLTSGPSLFLSSCQYRWDEWVPASRLLKYTEANLAVQKSLQVANPGNIHGGSTASKTQHKSSGKDNISTRAISRKDGTRGTKRAREEVRRCSHLTFSSFAPSLTSILLPHPCFRTKVTRNQT